MPHDLNSGSYQGPRRWTTSPGTNSRCHKLRNTALVVQLSVLRSVCALRYAGTHPQYTRGRICQFPLRVLKAALVYLLPCTGCRCGRVEPTIWVAMEGG